VSVPPANLDVTLREEVITMGKPSKAALSKAGATLASGSSGKSAKAKAGSRSARPEWGGVALPLRRRRPISTRFVVVTQLIRTVLDQLELEYASSEQLDAHGAVHGRTTA
jgi:hypothetical protein